MRRVLFSLLVRLSASPHNECQDGQIRVRGDQQGRLDAFIRVHVPASTPTWCEGEHPPDYYLDFGGQKFAVDVSILLKQVMLGHARLRPRDVRDAFADLVREVELSAKQVGVLDGNYIVYMPRAIPNLRQVAPLLKERMLKFVATTCASPAGVREVFYKVAGRRCVIEKVADHGSALFCGGPSGCRWATDAERELGELVAERIAAKAADLQRIAIPKILLLDDQYPFAEASMYRSLVRPISGTDDFHTIYVHRRGLDGILLTSRLSSLDRGQVWAFDRLQHRQKTQRLC
jgi:hypothetical protein